jgi:aquaporin Z
MSSVTAGQRAGPRAASIGSAVASRVAVAGRKYLVELIGTFFLVFTVAATAFISSPLAPLAVGAILMVMIYAGGHISGGHYNPAITLAALVRRRIDTADAIGYWIAQLAAGVLAALLARWAVHPPRVPTRTLTGHAQAAAFVAELLFTFALCYVMLNVATSRDQPVNSFYGLAIGFTVTGGAITVGNISGAAFNPAVTLGAATIGQFAWTTLWIYLLAQILAGILAGLTFRTLNPTDK